MTRSDPLPSFSTTGQPQFLILEAAPGEARHVLLEQWLATARQQGARTWLADCDMDLHGPWTGVRELFTSLVGELRRTHPSLISRHDYELVNVVPGLRRELTVRNPTLTDVAVSEEKVRNYPTDRAYRNVHGLINMMAEGCALSPQAPWAIACDNIDRAGSLVRTFFIELARRQGAALNLTLLLAVEPGQGAAFLSSLPAGMARTHLQRSLPSTPAQTLPAEEAARAARELEQRMGNDLIEIETHLPTVIRLWRQSGNTDKLLKSLALAHSLTNHYGLYEDALRYGGAMGEHLDGLLEEPSLEHWSTLKNLQLNSYISTRQVDRALAVALEMKARIHDPVRLVRLYYTLAMLYGRYLPKPDLAQAEDYLEQALVQLDKAELPADEKHFLRVFNRNGLAFIRHRQGRSREAIALCRDGLEHLNQHLRPDQHRLHRSVLIYNMAQVYAALGEYAQAIAHYTAAIQQDPNYSEYYNERGSMLLKRGNIDQALADFQRAVALSPPYAEAFINQGQCLRRMNRHAEAVAAYSTALDLSPARVLAWVGRAQSQEELGHSTEALSDYSTALELEPAQPQVLANKAILEYSAGQVEAALTDLDRAILLAPQLSDLYQNRAVALRELGRPQEAMRDLQTYLRLAPTAEDRQEVEANLEELRRAA